MSLMEIGLISLVLLVLAATGYMIRSYGTGFGARSVLCPHKGVNAAISTRWTTQHGVSNCEVLQCSLLPGERPVTCDMGCIAQL